MFSVKEVSIFAPILFDNNSNNLPDSLELIPDEAMISAPISNKFLLLKLSCIRIKKDSRRDVLLSTSGNLKPSAFSSSMIFL